MGTKSQPKTSRDKVRAHRRRLRKLGLRPIQIWVPDLRSPVFAKEARRQSLAVAKSPHAERDQDFIDAISSPDAA
ncbi:MAG: antitoxin MazE family protein [Candidatus Acidiferrum sp.]